MIWLKSGATSPRVLDPISRGLAARALSECTLRIVANRNDLVEKIQVFDDELDDRIIELVKFLLSRSRQLLVDESAGGLLYQSIGSQSSHDRLLHFVHYDADWNAIECQLPFQEGYEEASHSAYRDLGLTQPPQGRWELVDRAWARRFVEQK